MDNAITFKSLCRLRDLKAEVDELEKRMQAYEKAIDDLAEPDACEDKRSALIDINFLLAKRQEESFRELCLLEKVIDDIPDPHYRRIFHKYFVEGMTWNSLAIEMGGGNTPNGCRMACKRYFDATY